MCVCDVPHGEVPAGREADDGASVHGDGGDRQGRDQNEHRLNTKQNMNLKIYTNLQLYSCF